MKAIKANKFLKKTSTKRMAVFILVFIIIYGLLISAVRPKRYSLNVGDIPKTNIKAPRDTIDETATKEAENKAIEKVDKQYTQKSEIKEQAEQSLIKLFDTLLAYKSLSGNSTPSAALQPQAESSEETEKRINKIKEESHIKLKDDQYKLLLNLKKETLETLKTDLLQIVDEAYENNIDENNIEALQTARSTAAAKVDDLDLDADAAETAKDIVEGRINPNCFYDEEKTLEVQEEKKKSVQPIYVKQNQIIVKEGVPVTEAEIEILSSLGMLNDSNGINTYIFIYIGLAGLVIIIMLIQFGYIKMFFPKIYNDIDKIALIGSVNTLSVITARTLGYLNPLFIPFACAPILLTIFIDYRISMVSSVLNLIFLAVATSFDASTILIGLLATVLGAAMFNKTQQRNIILKKSLAIALIISLTSIILGMMTSNDIVEIFKKGLLTLGGSACASIMTIGLFPIIEAVFKQVTVMKLLELANPNSPVLKKLLMDAPGTYHHSMMVANLAELAAEEIGANSVLARVGAYYHDIGKTTKPYFYSENQLNGENPHNKIQPNVSAAIIISHVHDGIKIAEKNKLPQIIIDMIGQHHGTTLVKYFYFTMKNNSENPEEVNEEDYKYPGPIPASKEAGIIMLADSVEAAVKSIKEPTQEKIEKMINNIIDDKIASGQMNNCDLTIKDINNIKKCFAKALNGIYHQRVEYPKEIKKGSNEKENTENKSPENESDPGGVTKEIKMPFTKFKISFGWDKSSETNKKDNNDNNDNK